MRLTPLFVLRFVRRRSYTRSAEGVLERTADYAERSAACVALLLAVLQADAPGGGGFGAPLPGPLLPQAWAYLARLLNKLPPTNLVAEALVAALEMARARSAKSRLLLFISLRLV